LRPREGKNHAGQRGQKREFPKEKTPFPPKPLLGKAEMPQSRTANPVSHTEEERHQREKPKKIEYKRSAKIQNHHGILTYRVLAVIT
jgi:hypothetical protein